MIKLSDGSGNSILSGLLKGFGSDKRLHLLLIDSAFLRLDLRSYCIRLPPIDEVGFAPINVITILFG